MAQRRRPRQRQSKRSEQCHTYRDSQGAEKGSGDAGDGNERKKYHDGRQRRSDQWHADLAHGAANSFGAALAGVAVHHDVFYNHDGVVDHQSDGCGESAQGHQVKALPERAQRDECDCNGGWDHQAGDNRTAPIAQEEHQNDSGQQQSNQDGIAHAVDGFFHQIRLIVKRHDHYAFGQRLANAVDLSVHLVGYLHRVAIRLAIDIQ